MNYELEPGQQPLIVNRNNMTRKMDNTDSYNIIMNTIEWP